jgi:ferredoxin
MALVFFEREGKTLSTNAGNNLRKLAKENGISLYRGINKLLNCRGQGLCGTCLVEIRASRPMDLNPRTGMEEQQLKNYTNRNLRLACQVQVHGNISVKTQPVELMALEREAVAPPLVSGDAT